MDGPELPVGWRWNPRGRYAVATYTAGGVGYAIQVTTSGDVPEIQDETTEDPTGRRAEERGNDAELAYRRVVVRQSAEVAHILRRWLVDHPGLD